MSTTSLDIARDIKDRCFGGVDAYPIDEIAGAVSDAIQAGSVHVDTLSDPEVIAQIHRHVWADLTGTEWPW